MAILRALELWGFARGSTVYVASSDERGPFFAPLAAGGQYRLFLAENFAAELQAARVNGNQQLFAIELLLAVGADAYVETFLSQRPQFEIR